MNYGLEQGDLVWLLLAYMRSNIHLSFWNPTNGIRSWYQGTISLTRDTSLVVLSSCFAHGNE